MNSQKLVLALLIIFVAAIFFSLSPSFKALETQKILLPQIEASFVSPSTSNGHRRFLAIGNFFDTTNSAYYKDSVSTIKFALPKDKNILVQSAQLKLYKYASAAEADTIIKLSGSGNALGEAILDNGDYDYDVAAFEIGEFIKENMYQDVIFKLDVDNPQHYQGVAVCSGNFTDSICPTQYHPQLEISYIPNTKGTIKSLDYEKSTKFNGVFDSEYVKCQPNQGCKVTIKINYEDKEENGLITFSAKNIETQETVSASTTKNNTKTSVQLTLPDSDYELSLDVVDGGYNSSHPLGTIKIDTTPPKPPIIKNHSQYGSRSGVYFDLAVISEPGEFRIDVCPKLENGRCSSTISTQNFEQDYFQFRSQAPLQTELTYHYQIYAIDKLGNKSQPTSTDIKQLNNLVEINAIKTSLAKISPKNQDKKYDFTDINYNLSEQISDLQLVLTTQDYKELVRFSDPHRFMGKVNDKYLTDGIYYLFLRGKDQYGYPLADHTRIVVEIDNTPPKLFL